ncbi:glycoside hydrolase family 47 protein [Cucurbitaria berberidis CBS 394.84]|uniref:alpha-1,2-Mannosidase n=1 Tax=Cucurbitaria berberidis CBS 394.84 TaxID=1168544 RepID=A0A9P4GCI1_9PLEO|nr:glycoside hydrolase family 47 protein [Cucurbitaria berberidis CBS 394.84]KAF1843363.1 glycoside hydrolase family 47 protein [Cucurbitaria berberidis CBS 394.84]
MLRSKLSRGPVYQPMSRQHQRTLTYLLLGAITFGAYYIWSAPPIDPLAVPFHLHEAYMNNRDATKRAVSYQSYDWRTAPFVNKIESYIPLPTGKPHKLPPIQFEKFSETKSQRQRREAQRVAVREEFQLTWESYRDFAWAHDELRPVTGEAIETFGGWGATLVDSLDTLWIMGFKEEFYEAVDAVAAIDFGHTNLTAISVFETTIRYLGGLLSAYDLSYEPVLLEKAVQVGEMIYRAFDTTNNTPLEALDIKKAKSFERIEFAAETSICFACLGSLAMELTRLAQISAQPKFYDVVARVSALIDRMQDTTKIPGLWPTMVNAANEEFNQSRSFSIGALADSTYEYFPKMHALLGGLEPIYEKMFETSAAMMDKYMLFRPMVPNEVDGEDLLLCGEVSTSRPRHVKLQATMQHLTCFIGGMFGLAGRLFSDAHHVDLGGKLTKGCIYAYAAMPSGIMPENFDMVPCASRTSCPWNQTLWEAGVKYHYGGGFISDFDALIEKYNIPPGFTNIRDTRYLLRPEAIESVFIMYRITGDQRYLDDAWDMFTAIVGASATTFANGQVLDVTFVPPPPGQWTQQRVPGVRGGIFTREDNIENKMESFWTAETLKYFYLIFSPPDMMSLDDWVFNTEAHPFRRPHIRK